MGLLENRHHLVGLGIHLNSKRIDAGMNGIHPGMNGGCLKSRQGMTGNAVRPDDALGLQAIENFHLFFVAVGPIRGRHTMQKNQIDIIRAEFFEESADDDIGIRSFRLRQPSPAQPDFGNEHIFLAPNAFKSIGQIGMAAVKVGGIKPANPPFEAAAGQFIEFFFSEAGLV